MIKGYFNDEILAYDITEDTTIALDETIASIRRMNFDSSKDRMQLSEDARWAGSNLIHWGLSFEGTKRRIVTAARQAGFLHKELPALIDKLMLEGAADRDR